MEHAPAHGSAILTPHAHTRSFPLGCWHLSAHALIRKSTLALTHRKARKLQRPQPQPASTLPAGILRRAALRCRNGGGYRLAGQWPCDPLPNIAGHILAAQRLALLQASRRKPPQPATLLPLYTLLKRAILACNHRPTPQLHSVLALPRLQPRLPAPAFCVLRDMPRYVTTLGGRGLAMQLSKSLPPFVTVFGVGSGAAQLTFSLLAPQREF